MKVHLEPIVFTLRVYEDTKSFENKDDYVFVATVVIEMSNAFVQGAHGKMNTKIFRSILKALRPHADYMIYIRSDGKIRKYACT